MRCEIAAGRSRAYRNPNFSFAYIVHSDELVGAFLELEARLFPTTPTSPTVFKTRFSLAWQRLLI
jgi:hypothetical protein